MNRWPIVTAATALVCFAVLHSPTPATAQGLQISAPLTSGNLGVYFVDGGNPGGSAMVTLDQATAQGTAKIFQQKWVSTVDPVTHRSMYVNGPVAIQNLSATQSLFIQAGDLVSGGLQDQVVIRSIIIPPLSTRVSIDTLCVDPFRSTARVGDNADFFSAAAALFPWRLAKLGALANNSAATVGVDSVRDIRQLAIWWSIDSLRTRLTEKLGVPLEPARSAAWVDNQDVRVGIQLQDRHGDWKNSLPLSLENPRLARAEQRFVDALGGKAGSGDIIGAVFVINGQVEGADIYRSHALFQQMWPKLLRAYAAQAIADAGRKTMQTPSVGDIRGFLSAAEQAPSKVLDGGNVVHESDAALYAVTSYDGAWVYRSYVAKHPSDATSPEAVLVNILETGTMAGHQIADLTGIDMIVLHRQADGRFVAALDRDPTYTESTPVATSTMQPFEVANANPPAVTSTGATTFDARWSADSAAEIQPANHEAAPVDRVRPFTGPSLDFIDLLMILVVAVAGFVLQLIWRNPPAKPSLPKAAAATMPVSRRLDPRRPQPAPEVNQPAAATLEPVPVPLAQRPAAEPPISLNAYRRRVAKAAKVSRTTEPAVRKRAA